MDDTSYKLKNNSLHSALLGLTNPTLRSIEYLKQKRDKATSAEMKEVFNREIAILEGDMRMFEDSSLVDPPDNSKRIGLCEQCGCEISTGADEYYALEDDDNIIFCNEDCFVDYAKKEFIKKKP